jgi:predicted  nucleic acid-binding Zn-ribbon protein
MLAASASSSNEPSDISAPQMGSLQESISKVEVEIADVVSQIKEVEQMLKTPLNTDDLKYWRTKEQQLRVKEQQLRDKELQLRAKEERLRVEKLQLRAKEERLSTSAEKSGTTATLLH